MNQDPMREWVLRDEILAAFHRWPMILAFALTGMILGLIISYFWPSSYRATLLLSVELNPYRLLDDKYIPEFTEAQFHNIDDYKHWQMLQLSILVKSDPYLNETLTRLREIDPYWKSIEIQDLREMLEANWRNAGEWLLVADTEDSIRAAEAVKTWQEVIQEFTDNAIARSRELLNLELTLRSLNDELVANQLQQTNLDEILGDLTGVSSVLAMAEKDSPIEDSVRSEMFLLANRLAGLIPNGHLILEDFPEKDGWVNDYLEWIDRVSLIVEKEIETTDSTELKINEQISSTESYWEAGIQEAQGLSATLSINNPQDKSPEVRQVRPYSLAALIGTFMGLLLWILVFLFQITRKGYL